MFDYTHELKEKALEAIYRCASHIDLSSKVRELAILNLLVDRKWMDDYQEAINTIISIANSRECQKDIFFEKSMSSFSYMRLLLPLQLSLEFLLENYITLMNPNEHPNHDLSIASLSFISFTDNHHQQLISKEKHLEDTYLKITPIILESTVDIDIICQQIDNAAVHIRNFFYDGYKKIQDSRFFSDFDNSSLDDMLKETILSIVKQQQYIFEEEIRQDLYNITKSKAKKVTKEDWITLYDVYYAEILNKSEETESSNSFYYGKEVPVEFVYEIIKKYEKLDTILLGEDPIIPFYIYSFPKFVDYLGLYVKKAYKLDYCKLKINPSLVKEAKSNSFNSLINHETLKIKEKTVKQFMERLHELIDEATPSRKGRVICKAIREGYLLKAPSKVIYCNEFCEGNICSNGEFESIQKYFRHWNILLEEKELLMVNSITIF